MGKLLPLDEVGLAQCPDDVAQLLGSDAVAAELEAVVERGRAAWPELTLPAATFISHLIERLAVEATPRTVESLTAHLRGLHADDLYLACACSHGNKSAIEVLSRRYLGQLPSMIGHMRLSRDEVEDIAQTLGERLFIGRADARPRIVEYSGRGALQSWIRMAAIRAALDRRRRSQKEPVDVDPQAAFGNLSDGTDPQREHLKQRYRQHFEEALRTALSHLSAEQRNILRLHFLDGLSIDKLAALFKVHRATAARWIVAAQRALLQDMRADLQERLKLNHSEIDSIAKLVRSQLHLSLPFFLIDAAEPGGPGRWREPGGD